MQVTLLMACILNAFSFSKWYCTFKTKDYIDFKPLALLCYLNNRNKT